MTKFTTFTTAKKLAKTLLASIIMSPITLSTAVITLSSVDNIVAMEDSKSIKTDVDLNNGIGKIVSETINNNIKAKAELLKEQGILNSNDQYWAKQAIESKSKHSSSIDNLKKLFVLAKEHNNDENEEFSEMFVEAIGPLIKENGGEINGNNEASIFALLNGLTIYNSLYTIYNSYEYDKGTRSLDKEDLDLLYEKTFVSEVFARIKSYQILENFIVNKYKSENINFEKFDGFESKDMNILAVFLKHDWDCYLTQFGIINDIENKKGDVLTESVVKQVKMKEIAPGQIARFVTKQYEKHKKHSAATKINSRVKGYLARKKIKNTRNGVNKLQQIQNNLDKKNKKILSDAFNKIKNDNKITKNKKSIDQSQMNTNDQFNKKENDRFDKKPVCDNANGIEFEYLEFNPDCNRSIEFYEKNGYDQSLAASDLEQDCVGKNLFDDSIDIEIKNIINVMEKKIYQKPRIVNNKVGIKKRIPK